MRKIKYQKYLDGISSIIDMDKKEILIDCYFYDVTDFVKKHPGT